MTKDAPFLPAGYCNKIVFSLLYRMPSSATYAVLPAFTLMRVSCLQSQKTPKPNSLTLAGSVISCKASQALKADSSMASKPSCRCNACNWLHELNALSQMRVTPAGISMDVSSAQPPKDQRPMVRSVDGSFTSLNREHSWKAKPSIVSRPSFSVIVVSCAHSSKAPSPMLFTLAGSAIVSKEMQL